VGDIEIWVIFVIEISTKKKYWFQKAIFSLAKFGCKQEMNFFKKKRFTHPSCFWLHARSR
jgi:hypothetical protein